MTRERMMSILVDAGLPQDIVSAMSDSELGNAMVEIADDEDEWYQELMS